MSVTPNRQISVKFDIGNFYENLSKNPNAVGIGQRMSVFYMKTEVRFIVEDDIK
jgi:hypothetical protein